MKTRKPVETEEQLLEALEEMLCDVTEDEPIEDINAELKEFGYDPDALGQYIGEMATKTLADSPLNWRTQARREIDAAKASLGKFENTPKVGKLDRTALVSAIQQLLGKLGYSDGRLVPAHFRNFETTSEQDLLSLLQQLEYLASDKDSQED